MQAVGEVSRARAYGSLAFLVVVYALNFIDRNILTVLLQPIKEELQVSDTAMGVLTGLTFAVFYTLAGIPIARLADRGSRRSVMAVGVAFWSLMTAASGLARSYVQLALARIGVGIGEASATPAAHSLISDMFPPEQRTGAIAVYNMGASLGILFGLMLGGWLQQTFGWRVAFAVVGLPGLLIAVLCRIVLPEPLRGQSEGRTDVGESSVLETLRYLASLPSFRHLCIAASLYSMSAYGVLGWAPTFMKRVHDLGYTEIGIRLGLVIGIGGAVGQLAVGLLCDRLGARDRRWLVWVPALCGIASLPFFGLFAWGATPAIALAAFVPVNLLNAVFAAPTYSLAHGLARLRMRAMASAIVLFVLNLIGLGLGPTLVGVLNDWLEPAHGTGAIRISLTLAIATTLWGALHSLLAARTLRADLAATARLDGIQGSDGP